MFATSFICLKCFYMYVCQCVSVRVRVCTYVAADCAVVVAPCKVHVYCVLC